MKFSKIDQHKESAMIFVIGLFLGVCIGVVATSLVYINKGY